MQGGHLELPAWAVGVERIPLRDAPSARGQGGLHQEQPAQRVPHRLVHRGLHRQQPPHRPLPRRRVATRRLDTAGTRSDGQGGHTANGRPPEGQAARRDQEAGKRSTGARKKVLIEAASGADVSLHPAIWIRDAACTDVGRKVDAARGGTADTGLGLRPGLLGQRGLSLLRVAQPPG
jgi:hypothetical protein